MILGVSLTVSGSIACREAGLLPPAQRFLYLWFKRALRCRRYESKIQQSIYEKSLEKLGLSEFSVMSERLPLSRTLAALRARLNQELLDEYKQVSPTRAYFLEGPPPTKLTKASCAVFQLRTESAKTKDWRWRHNQPLDDEPFNRTCRLCKRAQETVVHLVQECPSTEARQARRILKSYYTRAKQDVPVGPHEILRRSEDAELRKVQDEGLYAFVESLDLDGLLMGQLRHSPTLDQSC